MPYNLSLTNNTGLTTLQDGTFNNESTSLTLVGKNYPGYGTFLNENFIHLLENFANGIEPANALPGQLWWDSNTAALKINSSDTLGISVWKQLAAGASGTSAPLNPEIGDLWWNTGLTQLNVWGGASWVIVGPAFTTTTGQTGALADTIVGSTGGVESSHVVVKFFVSNKLAAILSTDATFTPTTAIAGFSVIRPGFNLNTSLNPGLVYYGDSNSALNLKVGGVDVAAANFLRGDVSIPITTKLTIASSLGVEIGTNANLTLDINGTGDSRISSTRAGKDLIFYVNKTVGGTTEVLRLSGTTGLATLQSDPSGALGIATKQYVDTANTSQFSSVGTRITASNSSMKTYVDNRTVLRDAGGTTSVTGNITLTGNISPSANATATTGYNIGSNTNWYSNVWAYTFRGISTTAQYADLAEKYVTDHDYPAGTVVQVGGPAEVTACSLNGIAIGVVSEKPAFLMNESAPGQAIALKGRVPVLVLGAVNKGDGLAAGPNGHAITTTTSSARQFAVALEDNTNEESKFVECVIL